MSDRQDVHSSFFHLSYVRVESHLESSVDTSKGSSVQITRAKSIKINRCRYEHNNLDRAGDNGCGCCQSSVNELQSTPNPTKLALFVSPSITHKFLDTMDETKQINGSGGIANNENRDFLENKLDLRKSLHPCLFNGGSSDTIFKDTNFKSADEHDGDSLPRLIITGIITSDQDSALSADVIIFDLDYSSTKTSTNVTTRQSNQFTRDIMHFSSQLNHETASDAPWSVMKAFPVRSISSSRDLSATQNMSAIHESNSNDRRSIQNPDLPCCPVCLHRIDPATLGLPDFKQYHKCSRWCSGFSNACAHDKGTQNCANEMKLKPWPPPARCTACDVICQRNSTLENESVAFASTDNNKITSSSDALKCHKCGMTSTLWVCLTCGVVGCGRYTLKHAADHFTATGHPYSLELATMRIWDYENGSFVQRKDLLECPILSAKWGNDAHRTDSMQFTSSLIASSQSAENDNFLLSRGQQFFKSDEETNASLRQNDITSINNAQPSCQNDLRQNLVPDKLSNTPKKSIMVSQEYEALLQSALEDQAMHFEGEISRLRAELASSRMNHSQAITDRESREIEALRKDSERLKCELEKLSSTLLESQTEESKSRALSQKLLREQSISKELLDRLRKDIQSEGDSCRQRMDDLELQIEDLTVNLRMRAQIAESEELNQAQIFGTLGGEKESKSNKKKGKKSMRFGRKK